MTSPAFNLDAKHMNATATAPGGAIDHRTIFEFTQDGDTAEARYSGGRIRVGQLVGIIKNNAFEFRYAQVHTDGSVHGGHSRCTIDHAPDGRIRIVEHYKWADGGTGTNIIEELPDPPSPSR